MVDFTPVTSLGLVLDEVVNGQAFFRKGNFIATVLLKDRPDEDVKELAHYLRTYRQKDMDAGAYLG